MKYTQRKSLKSDVDKTLAIEKQDPNATWLDSGPKGIQNRSLISRVERTNKPPQSTRQ